MHHAIKGTMQLARLERLTRLDLVNFLALFPQDDRWTSMSWLAALTDFRCMYRELGPGIRRIGIYKARIAPSDADDFVHDVLLKVWKKRHEFRGEAPLKVWVFQFAYNEARNRAKLKRLPVAPGVDYDALDCDRTHSPETRALQGEAAAQLAIALGELSEPEQQFFNMYSCLGNATECERLFGLQPKQGAVLLDRISKKLPKILARLQREHGWRKR